jgi:GT2 family glycosyltransferase
MLVRKNVFDRLGAFASDLRYHEDTDFWLRTREANLPVLVMPQTALIYRIHGSNLTTGQTLKSTGFIRILKRSLDRRKATQTGPQRAAVPPLTLVGQSATRASHVDYANFSVNGKPRVSIILHQSAREDDCDQALQSILNQGVQPLELVLTGQHIPEETITKAQDAFGQIHIVNAISDDLADQLNEAVSLAQGEWLTFLSTNAVWTEGKLKAQLDVLRTDPKIKIVSGHTSPIIDPRKPYPAKTLDSLQLQKRIGDFLDTLMVERSILDEIGPFKNKASGMMETDWLLRAKDLGFTPLVLPKVLLYRTIKPETNAPSPEELRSALFNSLHSSIQRKRKPKTD